MVETGLSEQALQSYPPQAIAIVGLAGRFPDARNLDDFWRNIRAGRESLETFSDAELDAAGVPAGVRNDERLVRKGTVLEGAELFDARFFGISPREAQILDPQHRIFLECAWEALEHAGYAPGATRKTVGVYAGSSMNTYLLRADPARPRPDRCGGRLPAHAWQRQGFSVHAGCPTSWTCMGRA